MQDTIFQYYQWIKALHIIAVIAWMAGLLYLPRLFVYHADAEVGSDVSETLKVMERRLLKFIMAPASVAVWVFGGLMLWVNWDGLIAQGWIHVKLLMVVLMTGMHHAMMAWTKRFAADMNEKPAKFYRIMNEVPTVLMIIIVIMAVVRPF